jgi:prepilin signal peptidase PulO-like enzyme (type II secretory pathway)
VFLSALLVASLIDGEHMVVSDVVSILRIVTGLVAAWMGWGPPFRSSLLAVVVGGLLIALLAIVTRGGVGSGDAFHAASSVRTSASPVSFWRCGSAS